MGKDTPYRAPVQMERAALPKEFTCAWTNAETATHPMGVYYGLVLGLLGSGFMASVTPVAGVAGAVGTLMGVGLYSRKARRATGLRLTVEDGTLHAHHDGRLAAVVGLDALREVVVDSKGIQRVTFHQEVGAALPDTRVGGQVDIARIALVCEDGQRLVLTETYAAYSECMEHFGKVRVFLRKHGWLPEDERAKREA